jgi:N-6 DNA Methylase
VAGAWGDPEIRLARDFDELHRLLYMHGGIRPTNAAVEEVAKLIFLRLWSLREPTAPLGDDRVAADLFRDSGADGATFAQAFPVALASAGLKAQGAHGADEPIWPLDEPFRLRSERALAAAVGIVRGAVDHTSVAVADPLGTAFDALLSGRYDHAGGLGTYLTPSGVARMMAEIAVELAVALPPARSAVAGCGDPFCGTGRFLVALRETLAGVPGATARRLQAAGLFGADQSASAVAKARINLLLYGVSRPRVWTVADSNTDATLDAMRGCVPLLLTNPPFGENTYGDVDGTRRVGEVIPSLARARALDPALAGLVRCLDLLAPQGVLGIVLPDGILSSHAFDELLHTRHGSLAGQISVAANVSLPVATFALSGTVAKTSAVFLRRAARPSGHARPARVALARVEHVGYLRQGGRAAPDPAGNELAAVSEAVRRGLRARSTASLTVESDRPLVAVLAYDAVVSFDPSRLDPDAVQARRSLLENGGAQLRDLLAPVRPRRCRDAGLRPYVSVLHVDDLGAVDWAEAARYAPSTPGIVARAGELIVSLLNPAKLRAAVVPEHFAAVQVSAEFGVFTATGGTPYAILGLLQLEQVRCQLRPLGRGTSSSRRRIDADDVLSLVVPKLDPSTLGRIDADLRRAYQTIAAGREAVLRSRPDAG